MIDLSQYVDKQTTVQLRDGSHVTGVVSKSTSECYPFIFNEETYTQEGLWWRAATGQEDYQDIVAIEEIEPISETAPEVITEVNYKQQVMQIGTILGEAFPECDITAVDMARLVMDQLKTLRMAAGLPTFDQARNQTNS